MKSRVLIPVVVVIALVAVAWVLLFYQPAGDRETLSAPPATVFGEDIPVTGFKLTDHHNQPFTPDSLQGHWTLLFFGYTHCPDVCPNTMQVFKLMQDSLQDKVQDTRFVFVSVDPERDTLEELKSYTGYFHPDFLGVTGSHDDLTRLTRQLGVLYVKSMQSKDGKYYLVDHSASVILVDPQGNYRAVYSAPHDPDAMSQSFLKIYSYYEGKQSQ